MPIQPKTWTDEEILDVMETEAKEYKQHCIRNNETYNLREMLDCVLSKLKENYLIEDTP